MKYVPPLGEPDGTGYVDGNPSAGIEGSIVSFAAIEHPMREIEGTIVAAGMTPDAGDLSQLTKAIKALVWMTDKTRGFASVKDWGAVGDGASHPLSAYFPSLITAQVVYPHAVALTDEIDGIAIQGAINAGYVAVCPAGIFLSSRELVIRDGSGLLGVNPFYKRRTSYVYSAAKHSVIKYVGVGGANSCALRVSQKAVGAVGTSFAGADTDDLTAYRLENIHVDANGLTEYAWYFYRAGNAGAIVNNLTCEKATKHGALFLGMFAGYFGTIAAYECAGRGIVVGEDVFNWAGGGSSEANCYNFSATFIAANNGTLGNFVEYTAFAADTAADEYGCGVYIRAGRGSKFRVGSEGNFGRSMIIDASSSGGGPLEVRPDYLEANGAGPKIKNYGRFSNGVRLTGGFIYPVTQSGSIHAETIKIYALGTNDGPGFSDEWLVLDGLLGQSGYVAFNINSNTNKFKVINSSGAIKYPTTRPLLSGVIGKGYFKADATLSDTRYIKGNPLIDTFYGDGATANFTLAYAPTGVDHISVYVDGVRKTATTHYTLAGATLTFTAGNIPTNGQAIVVAYSNMKLSRTAPGQYVVTFLVPEPDAEYEVDVTCIQPDGSKTAASYTPTTAGFEIRTATVAAPTTLSDIGQYIQFSVKR